MTGWRLEAVDPETRRRSRCPATSFGHHKIWVAVLKSAVCPRSPEARAGSSKTSPPLVRNIRVPTGACAAGGLKDEDEHIRGTRHPRWQLVDDLRPSRGRVDPGTHNQ